LVQDLLLDKDYDKYIEKFQSKKDVSEGILRGVFQNINPLCGRNPIETDLD